MYLWEKNDWPAFNWDEQSLTRLLTQVSHEQGRLLGRMESLGFSLRNEAHLRTLTADIIKSSEIEGEILDHDQVRSSIARRLGIDIGGITTADHNIEGVVEMMMDATTNYATPLTTDRLFSWHASLFPTGRSGMRILNVGCWRTDLDGPMQVISGSVGREKVHYQAPPADRISKEMDDFIGWFEQPGDLDPLLIAGLAHLWFITVHPFDDGNGRIARAIADMALARSEQTSQRFYSMSTQIRHERKGYYDLLEKTQKGQLDITHWHEWFLNCLQSAISGAQETLAAILGKAHFWERFAKTKLNERQIKMLNKLLDGFDGKLTTSKWAKITKCSQDTAYRDILNLIELGALKKDEGGGRSTSYSVWLDSGEGTRK